jgi:cytochrome c oxidase subunit 3
MAMLSRFPNNTVAGSGNRGPAPPAVSGGGGGGDSGRGDGDGVRGFREQLQRYRLGLSFTVASIVMMFIAFTSLFAARREAGKFDPLTGGFQSDWVPVSLPMKILLINSAVLLLACVFIEIAKRAARLDSILIPMSLIPGVRPIRQSSPAWVWVTALAGVGFLYGQYYAWRQLHLHHGLLNSGPASTFIVMFTGTHAVHVAAGLLVLFYLCLARGPRESLERRCIILDVTALYWHFLAIMWMYVLLVLKLMD